MLRNWLINAFSTSWSGTCMPWPPGPRRIGSSRSSNSCSTQPPLPRSEFFLFSHLRSPWGFSAEKIRSTSCNCAWMLLQLCKKYGTFGHKAESRIKVVFNIRYHVGYFYLMCGWSLHTTSATWNIYFFAFLIETVIYFWNYCFFLCRLGSWGTIPLAQWRFSTSSPWTSWTGSPSGDEFI